MKLALLLIDIQNDYFRRKVELKAPLLARSKPAGCWTFSAGRVPTVHIQQVSNRPGATFFPAQNYGRA